ncbi:hypothetical protein M2459_003254 [Parabacteroides sp. PF5-5]|uniref:hypothetical protein n=1 Tax=unclassified Parabacteroides TaxID=2649774 RepID=UPI0024746D57|nr:MULTISPECIES: hypothetical protein [unclassified Parabacteroides]MDH6306490.1 hypothetical protein [Parabacteroides sp. PH5-39]MDH6317457.1 hypothetical protein [Parabacteroides sp. PF5-13]MDH6321240.1 hypothetical protein [Parabacteroides sp. PH5-13]MDH6324972.1 hypothetical protein [Parabacteroides sp. PH5-8]MDH6328681.1 hypothetical protein [Parabacteroides sp. PH5-41]
MNKVLKTTIYLKQVRIMVFLLGLLLTGGQMFAQQATLVEVFIEDFERPEFSGEYILPNPGIYGSYYDFTYATAVPMASNIGECIITKNSNQVGHGNPSIWSHPDHSGTGYYLFAVKEAGTTPKKIYAATVPYVRKGETVKFGLYYDDVDGGYNFEIQATGTGLGGATNTSDNFYNSGGGWQFWSYSATATQDGEITFSIVDKYGYYDKSHKFGIDDITVTMKAIQIVSPASFTTYTKVNTQVAVPFQAKYYNPLGSNTDTYTWQKYNGSSWITATGTEVAEPGNATSFTTKFTPTAETVEGSVNYRLAVTAGSDTFYSDIITVEYIANEYLFMENFGGNWPSTDQTDPAGASGDWWIQAGSQPTITTEFSYGQPDKDASNKNEIKQAYGEIPIKLDVDGVARYAITKLAGWQLPLPGYSGQEWKWGHGDGSGKKGFDDHTIPGDNSRGYFMYSLNPTNGQKTVYETTIPVTEGMKGKSFAFNAWQVALWGRDDGLTYQFKMEVEKPGSTLTSSAEFGVSDGWEEKELLFHIPSNYSEKESYIKIRISSFGNNLWLGLDDISVTEHDTHVIITSPNTESHVGSNVSCMVNYKFISSSIKYKWQKSNDGNGWTDIAEANGTAVGISGNFATNISSVEDGYYFRILITTSDDTDFTEAMASAPIQLFRDTNYLIKEDFKGCGSTQNFIYKADNIYDIPGYTYTDANAETVRPNPGSGYYIITNQVYLNYWTDSGSSVESTTDWYTDITDHTGCNGYFLLVHARKQTEGETMKFYETTLSDLCPGSKLSFKAWIADLERNKNTTQKFKFLVSFDNGHTEEYITETISGGNNAPWIQYGLDFFVPQGVTTATLSILAEGDSWDWGKAFAMDDIEIKQLNPVQIITPDQSEISILSGQTASLTGSYACGELSGDLTYQWESSPDRVTWTEAGTPTNVANGNFETNEYTTTAITSTVYYRLTVKSASASLSSEPLKIVPTTISPKTYFVCPDNMTDDQATRDYRKGGGNVFLPGMVSKGEPGYLPSLIYLEVPEINGIIYKWYTSETAGSPLTDQDEYDKNQNYTSGTDVQDPILVSDGKTHTISIQNERNTEGKFANRTYWVEICDSDGNPLPNTVRIPFHLEQGYLCGSIKAIVSTANSRRIHREDFGGTSDSDPKIKTDPPANMIIDYDQHILDDQELPEGSYLISKESPTLNNSGWKAIEDHIYEGIANEKHGYLVAINANEEPGRFYTYQMDNLGSCRNIEMVFTGWFASPVTWNGTEKANLKFTLTDTHTGLILAEFISGNMVDEENKWRQFGFRFFVPDQVTSISLEVVNNNFGTSGGNDVLMDDIEIYLAMPPVTLVPSLDSYICQENAENAYGIATLEGSYTDDGTLGDYLDYWWEFRKDGTDTWVLIPGTNNSVSNGVVTTENSIYTISKFTDANNGDYRLVVGQAGTFGNKLNYDCLAVSEPRKLTFSSTVAPFPTPSLEDNTTAFCYNDVDENGYVTITNKDNGTYSRFSWLLDGAIIQNSSSKELKLKLEDYEPGYYTISLTAFNEVECSNTSIHRFLIFPKVTTWTGKGELNNWNDFKNWDNGVPGDCTNAIIPNASISVDTTILLGHYPNLLKPTVETLNGTDYKTNQDNLNKQQQAINEENTFSLRPACDSIMFKMGGGVARTDYLKYRFAYVDLDIKPNRWYTLSAPLRSMYSGDYFIIGNVARQNPTVYMMKYNAKNPQTSDIPAIAEGDFSNPFNTLTEDLYPGLGYAVWVDDGKTASEKEIQPFRFPKDSTQYTMWNYHGVELGKTEWLNRSYKGRFTYERNFTGSLPNTVNTASFDVTIETDKTSYSTTLVGNPFMSHLNFSKFASANGITGGYYIWTSGETFEAINPSLFSNDPNEIAPMQAFIIKAFKDDLTFTFDMSVTTLSDANNNNVLRSTKASTENTVLRMDVLRDSVAQSNIRLRYIPLEENTYSERKDMWTLFSEDVTTPAVLYTLLDGKAASIRTLGDLSKPIELGIRTSEKGKLTLRLSGMETLDISENIYLEDKLTGKIHNLRDNPDYTFENETGNVTGRLFLRIGDATIEEGTQGDWNIRVTTYNNTIAVSSLPNDPIESVRIYSIQGKLLYEKKDIKQTSFSVLPSIEKQVIIVAVTTNQHRKKQKVMIK